MPLKYNIPAVDTKIEECCDLLNTITTPTVSISMTPTLTAGPPTNDDISIFEYTDISASSPSTGNGAQYSYTFTPDGELWLLTVSVTNGGSGYVVGNLLEFVREPLETNNGVSLYEVTVVDGFGAITEISLIVAEPMIGSS